MSRAFRRTLVLVLGSALWVSGHADLYRYENDEGKIVYDHHVPPKFVHKGYTVLSEEGRVIRVVAPELTPVEKVVRDARVAAEKAEQRRLDDQRDNDIELLRLYKSVGDVERARDRKVRTLQGAIDLTEENLSRLVKQKQNVESRAADLERGGLPVSEEVMENLRVIDEQIAERRAEIEARSREQDAVRVEYDKDKERVSELLRRAARGYSSS